MSTTTPLGRYLRILRRERKLKLKDVADAVGKSLQYIHDIEEGRKGTRPRPELLIALSEYFNVPITGFFQAAGLEIDENNPKFNLYHKVLRNKVKSMKIINQMDAMKELLLELESATMDHPHVRGLAKSLMNSYSSLEASLLHDG